MPAERLQKLLAQAGVASRRAAEALILEGRVRVNGRVVNVLGSKADLHVDKVEVDGRRVVAEKPAYYLVNKPREVVTTLDDPEGRNTIKGLLRGVTERVYPVGRLDYHTSGALLVTNDGAMAQALLHPTKQVPKTYVAKVRGHLHVPQLDQLRNGVDIGHGETTRKAELFVLREEGANTWVQITITEGKNRQVHRMFEALGSRVSRLSRIAFAGLTVEGLRPGDHRPLKATELTKLKRDFLNPAKRAAVAAVQQAALDAAMRDLGYEAFEGEEPSIGPRPRTQRARSARKRTRTERAQAREDEAQQSEAHQSETKRPARGDRPRAGGPRTGPGRTDAARGSGRKRPPAKEPRGPMITRVGTTRRARGIEPSDTEADTPAKPDRGATRRGDNSSPRKTTVGARKKAAGGGGGATEATTARKTTTARRTVVAAKSEAGADGKARATVVRRKKATPTDARSAEKRSPTKRSPTKRSAGRGKSTSVVVRRRRADRDD